MEIKENYNPLGMQIEGEIRKAYEDAFNGLKQVDSYQGGLEFIANMFEALGKSKPNRGNGIEWAGDVIPAYRNLGKIIRQISQLNLSLGADWEYLENLGKLLEEYGDGTKEELEEALKVKNLLYNYKIEKDDIESLSEIKKVLEKYGIEGAKVLDDSLRNEENLQGKLEKLEGTFG